MIKSILNEINENNSSTYKINVLKKYKDNDLLFDVLELTYNRQKSFGVSKSIIEDFAKNNSIEFKFTGDGKLKDALTILNDEYCTRKITGHDAIKKIISIISALTKDDAEILLNVINRDLKLNLGIKSINKVRNIIPETPYMRCALLNKKTIKKIKFPAIIQLKADGMCIFYQNGEFWTRQGHRFEIFNNFKQLLNIDKNIILQGEFIIKGCSRQESNGLINSLVKYLQNKNKSLTKKEAEEIQNKITYQVWDYIEEAEYYSKEGKTPYIDRLNKLKSHISSNKFNNVEVIETYEVKDISEAFKKCSVWMKEGYEGAVLKDKNNIFKNGTSNTQLKMKVQCTAEFRIIGYIPGTKGTKREKTFGAIKFQNDECTIKGSASGLKDADIDMFMQDKDYYIGKIVEIEFNDIIKSENNNYYALSHPRFVKIREDKDETDSLKRVKNLLTMAKDLG